MDLSFWKTANPDVKVEFANKRFYGKFYYCLVFNLDRAYLFNRYDYTSKSYHEIKAGLHISRFPEEIYNIFRFVQVWATDDVRKKIKITSNSGLRIYSEDEDTIKSLLSDWSQRNWLVKFNKIITVIGPESDEHRKVMEQGQVLVKRSPKFKYRLAITNGQYPNHVVSTVTDYIKNADTPLKPNKILGTILKNMPRRSNFYLYNSFLYTDDLGVATFLNLIHPGIIRKVEEYIQIPTQSA